MTRTTDGYLYAANVDRLWADGGERKAHRTQILGYETNDGRLHDH